MPRATIEAAIPIPTLVPVLRAWEGVYVVVADNEGIDVERVRELVKGVGVDVGVDIGVDTD